MNNFLGELIGTFILVFFGCGAVAVSVLFSTDMGLFQVAGIWGGGLTLAIYSTRHLCKAHFNPAISIAMVINRKLTADRLPVYIAAQFMGAFVAAGVLYLLFSGAISEYETLHKIVRGSPESVSTAMMFGEFYPNPGTSSSYTITAAGAFLAEAAGTFALAFFIFALTDESNNGRPADSLIPLFIGIALMVLICIIAPLTQAGFNPARDLAPRVFAYLAGWGKAAMPDENLGFLTVYVFGPVAGAAVSALFYKKIVSPSMQKDK